jgi:hypothetical protein
MRRMLHDIGPRYKQLNENLNTPPTADGVGAPFRSFCCWEDINVALVLSNSGTGAFLCAYVIPGLGIVGR